MGVVRGHQEGLAEQAMHIQLQTLGNAGEHILQNGGVCAVYGGGADLLTVQGAEYRDILAFTGGEEALEAAPHALQVVQPLGGDVFLLYAPHAGLLPDVQVQVVAQDFAPGLFFQKLGQLALGIFAAQQGIHVHYGVPLVAVVGLAVHVDGHVGDQQQVPVNV